MSILGEWDMLIPDGVIEKAEALNKRAAAERENGVVLYPPQTDLFKALDLAPEDVKVVILGQDPYHEDGQANGLAFSVNKGCALPPSLKNIYKELAAEYEWDSIPTHGDLSCWVEQGVLLLNTALTVYEGEAASCQDWNWDEVTGSILHACMLAPQPIVFLLWGKHAMDAAEKNLVWEEPTKHIIRTSHPSPLGATKSGDDYTSFLGSGQFKQTNVWLTNHGVKPVEWTVLD